MGKTIPTEHAANFPDTTDTISRINQTDWEAVATHIDAVTSLSTRRAQVFVLNNLGASRKLMAHILEISPSTIDNNKQALEKRRRENPVTGVDYGSVDSTHFTPVSWTNDFSETITQLPNFTLDRVQRDKNDVVTPLKYIVNYNPAMTEPAVKPEKTSYIEYNPKTGKTAYVARIEHSFREKNTSSEETGRDEGNDYPQVARETELQTYSDPGIFAYEHLFGAMNFEWAYDRLDQAPFFDVGFDETFKTYLSSHEAEMDKTTRDAPTADEDAPINLSGESIEQILIVAHRLSPEIISELLEIEIGDARNLKQDLQELEEQRDDDYVQSLTDETGIFEALRATDDSWQAYSNRVIDRIKTRTAF